MANASGEDPPTLPDFPDLSPLAATFPSSPPPADDDEHNLADIWASVPSNAPAPHTTVSTSGYHAAYSVPPPAPPPPAGPVNLDDLDPFAPASSQAERGGDASYGTASALGKRATLGSVVGQSSRLELIENSESDGGSPTENKDMQQEQASKATGQEAFGQGHKRDGSGGFFFRDLFRSVSGTPSKEQQVAARSADTPPPLPLPSPAAAHPHRPSTPPASSSSSAPLPPRTAPQTPSGPSTLAKPFTSIASVFRSTPKNSAPSSSAGSTPQPGSSPVLREKGGFMTAIAGSGAAVKGKGKASMDEGDQREYDEKRDGKGKEREQRPEPVFDFNRFLEQMRMRSADPIAKYLRSFLKEFSRRPPVSPSDQARVINDFLDFIAGKMRACDPWKSTVEVENRDDPERGELEFDMAMEAMEKLVMNRVWHLTFTPALDLSTFPGHMSPSGDVERDHVLSQRIRLFQWIEPKHLDLPIPSPSSSAAAPPPPAAAPTEGAQEEQKHAEKDAEKELEKEAEKEKEGGRGGKPAKQTQSFLDFAQRELCKMNQYKAPRDKLICVLNCCKVIFGLMRHVASGEEGADTFIPFLIFVVLKANPENLVSNLQYIQRFRNPEKLSGEGGYYLSSLNAAISFIESLDASSLSAITQSEFEHHVADAVKTLAAEEPPPPVPHLDRRRSSAFEAASQTSRPTSPGGPPRFPTPNNDPTAPPSAFAESASASLVTPGDGSAPGTPSPTGVSFPESTKQFLLRGTDSVEKAMSKPLGALAKIFEQLEQTANEITGQTPPPGAHPRSPHAIPPAPLPPSPTPSLGFSSTPPGARPSVHKRRSYLAAPQPVHPSRPGLPPLPPSTGSLRLRSPPSPDPGMYAPEGAGDEDVLREIDRQHEEQRAAAVGTLESVFPTVEKEVLEMVLLSCGNDVGRAIDSLLEMQ
ncbi:hypothetical protein JCM10213_006792 [Rhodosporidiobolus nylandii]